MVFGISVSTGRKHNLETESVFLRLQLVLIMYFFFIINRTYFYSSFIYLFLIFIEIKKNITCSEKLRGISISSKTICKPTLVNIGMLVFFKLQNKSTFTVSSLFCYIYDSKHMKNSRNVRNMFSCIYLFIIHSFRAGVRCFPRGHMSNCGLSDRKGFSCESLW